MNSSEKAFKQISAAVPLPVSHSGCKPVNGSAARKMTATETISGNRSRIKTLQETGNTVDHPGEAPKDEHSQAESDGEDGEQEPVLGE